jgi:hypothetical protein
MDEVLKIALTHAPLPQLDEPAETRFQPRIGGDDLQQESIMH